MSGLEDLPEYCHGCFVYRDQRSEFNAAGNADQLSQFSRGICPAVAFLVTLTYTQNTATAIVADHFPDTPPASIPATTQTVLNDSVGQNAQLAGFQAAYRRELQDLAGLAGACADALATGDTSLTRSVDVPTLLDDHLMPNLAMLDTGIANLSRSGVTIIPELPT